MDTSCQHCEHDWHGLDCRHEVVVRTGWWLERERCDCSGSTDQDHRAA